MPHFDLGALAYGADYNPEQWPREVWREDVRLMGRRGEPRVAGHLLLGAARTARGAFEFGWLDEIMNLLHGGVRVNLATATASPHPGCRWRTRTRAR